MNCQFFRSTKLVLAQWNKEYSFRFILAILQNKRMLGIFQDPWINDRLPPHLVPEHYVVDLRPDFDYNTESDAYLFYGTSSVRYLCKEPTKYLILHTL